MLAIHLAVDQVNARPWAGLALLPKSTGNGRETTTLARRKQPDALMDGAATQSSGGGSGA